MTAVAVRTGNVFVGLVLIAVAAAMFLSPFVATGLVVWGVAYGGGAVAVICGAVLLPPTIVLSVLMFLFRNWQPFGY